MPCMKLIKKERIGSKIKRIYDKPQSSFNRLLQSPLISEKTKTKLCLKRETLYPIELKKLREGKPRKLFAFQNALAHKKSPLQS